MAWFRQRRIACIRTIAGPMMTYHKWDPSRQLWVKFSSIFYNCHNKKNISNCPPQNSVHYVQVSMWWQRWPPTVMSSLARVMAWYRLGNHPTLQSVVSKICDAEWCHYRSRRWYLYLICFGIYTRPMKYTYCTLEFIEAKRHMYASSKWSIIGSKNGLLLVRCQAIIWTNADLFCKEPLETNLSDFSYFFSKFKNFHWRKCLWKRHLRNIGHFV